MALSYWNLRMFIYAININIWLIIILLYTFHVQIVQSISETLSQANVLPSPDYDTLCPKEDAEEGSAAAECQDSIPTRDDVSYMAATLDQEERVHIDGDMMVGICLLCLQYIVIFASWMY